MAVMKNTSDKCSHCLSTCNLTTYRATVTSAEFRSQKSRNKYPVQIFSAPATRVIWTWIHFATQQILPSRCGNRMSWPLMELPRNQGTTSKTFKDQWGRCIRTPWLKKNWFPPSLRCQPNSSSLPVIHSTWVQSLHCLTLSITHLCLASWMWLIDIPGQKC